MDVWRTFVTIDNTKCVAAYLRPGQTIFCAIFAIKAPFSSYFLQAFSILLAAFTPWEPNIIFWKTGKQLKVVKHSA